MISVDGVQLLGCSLMKEDLPQSERIQERRGSLVTYYVLRDLVVEDGRIRSEPLRRSP